MQIIEPGETALRWLTYTSTGVNLTGATILVGLGGYTTEPTSWEAAVSTDLTLAASGVIRASIGAWATRPYGYLWGWTKVTLGGYIDITVAKNDRFNNLAGIIS